MWRSEDKSPLLVLLLSCGYQRLYLGCQVDHWPSYLNFIYSVVLPPLGSGGLSSRHMVEDSDSPSPRIYPQPKVQQ